MKVFRLLPCVLFVLPLGCADGAKSADPEAVIRANLLKLDPQDREAAAEQKYCAVETANRLGKMGKPIKMTIKDEAVFLCCKGCEEEAKKDPDKTLARVEELKIQTALEQLNPDDRKLAEAQKFCATDPESRLGSMGQPVKITVKGEPVFLCCKGCEKTARQDEDKTLAEVRKLRAANNVGAKEQ